MPGNQPGFSIAPPTSADSTSSTSHQFNSPTVSDDRATYTDDFLHDTNGGHEDQNADTRTETDSDAATDMSDLDSLAGAPDEEVERVALELLGQESSEPFVEDKPDLWASHIFNRPPFGSENDKEVAKAALPVFQSYLQILADTDWMYPTPACFKSHALGRTNRQDEVDLPAFANKLDWNDQALNLNDINPMRTLGEDHVPIEPNNRTHDFGDAEAEHEISLAEIFIRRPSYAAHGQLVHDVALLGV